MLSFHSLINVITQQQTSVKPYWLAATLLTAAATFTVVQHMRKRKHAGFWQGFAKKRVSALRFKRSSGGGSIALAILVFLGVIVGAALLFNLSWLMVLEVVIGFVLLALFYFWITSRAGK